VSGVLERMGRRFFFDYEGREGRGVLRWNLVVVTRLSECLKEGMCYPDRLVTTLI